MSLSATIKNNHSEMIEAANGLRDAVRAKRSTADLGQFRMRLAVVVRDKLAMQQAIIAKIDPASRNAIRGFDRVMSEDRDLRLSYSKHIADWQNSAIEQNYAGYALSVETMVSRLERHLRMLETELFEPILKLVDMPRHEPTAR